jgi:hypothetical protein
MLQQTIYSILGAARRYSSPRAALLGIKRKLLTHNELVLRIERTVTTLKAGIGCGDGAATAQENGPDAAAGCVAVTVAAKAVPLNTECAAPQFHEHFSALSPKALILTPSERERRCPARDPLPAWKPCVPDLSKSEDCLRELTAAA